MSSVLRAHPAALGIWRELSLRAFDAVSLDDCTVITWPATLPVSLPKTFHVIKLLSLLLLCTMQVPLGSGVAAWTAVVSAHLVVRVSATVTVAVTLPGVEGGFGSTTVKVTPDAPVGCSSLTSTLTSTNSHR